MVRSTYKIYSKKFPRLTKIALLFSFSIILLSTYARLVYSNNPTENIHTIYQIVNAIYLPAILAGIILLIALWAPFRKRYYRQQPILLPWVSFIFLGSQIALSLLAIKFHNLPIITSLHLIFSIVTASLLCWLVLASNPHNQPQIYHQNSLKTWAVVGLLILTVQIFLGIWTSTNAAALACPHFPLCQGTILPQLTFHDAFKLSGPITQHHAQVTIQMLHRYGALLTFTYLFIFALTLIIRRKFTPLRSLGWMLLLLTLIQSIFGIFNVEYALPIWTAIAHNIATVVIVLLMITVLFKLHASQRRH